VDVCELRATAFFAGADACAPAFPASAKKTIKAQSMLLYQSFVGQQQSSAFHL
jgi:hypothetical protein